VALPDTPRLVLREITTADAEFINDLLNSPKFLKYIGDRGIRSVSDAAKFIEDRYLAAYREHGFGLYVVESKVTSKALGVGGFVKRDWLDHPDLGFAFLPQYERTGYGYESASAMLEHGRQRLGFTRVFAITSPDNEASGGLLVKLGFQFVELTADDAGPIKLYSKDLRL
jgi:[ribosomal protein S5]-alanine N-acetyltransferase